MLALFFPFALQAQLIDYYQKPLQFERSRDFDAKHYLIKIDLDIKNKAFQGENTLTIKSLRDGLESCVLDAEDFSVSSVLNNWGEPLKFEQGDKKLTIHLHRPFMYGETFSFTVFYKGQNPERGLEFFEKTEDHPALVYSNSWVKYDQVSCPLGGGAESTSATAMTHRIIHDERAEQDFSSIGIVSHELAHQWWGDLITLRTWEHAWMNEGFGTYSDYLYFRYERGEDEGAINLEGEKNAYLREAKTRYMRPIVIDHYNRPDDLFDAHSYRKGACVLHMLRFIVGDKPFFRILKHFLHTHAFDVVDTHDFMNSVKAVTGQNLDWFFEQWIFKPGHPVFDISHSWDENTQTIKLTVNQIQDTSQRVPVFKTPVIIGIWNEKGKEHHKIWIKSDHEEFEFRSDQKPLMVRFDEGNYLLKEWSFLKDKEELIYQMQHDDVMGRKWAAGQLLRFKDDREVVGLLKECAQKDAFWAVRRAAIEALGMLEDRELIGLLEQTCTDENSKVRAASLNALGNFKSADLAEFFKQRFTQDDSYVAQAAALEAIGKTGDRNQARFLKKAAEMPSYRNVIRNAAQKALKQLEEDRP